MVRAQDTIQLLQETSRSEPLKKIEKKIETKILGIKKESNFCWKIY